MEGDSTHDRRYAPPAAHVEDIETPVAGPAALATRTHRFWAAMLDLGVAVGAALLLETLAPTTAWREDSGWWTPHPVTAALDFLLFLVPHGFLLVRRGQTIGKAILGIRIVRSDGGKPSALQLVGVRYGLFYALLIVPGAGVIALLVDTLLIFRKSRRCLHDMLADTIVVKT